MAPEFAFGDRPEARGYVRLDGQFPAQPCQRLKRLCPFMDPAEVVIIGLVAATLKTQGSG
jgi:hypothetical protein